jgi:hypothetical protein
LIEDISRPVSKVFFKGKELDARLLYHRCLFFSIAHYL